MHTVRNGAHQHEIEAAGLFGNMMPVILGNKEAKRLWMGGERDFLGWFKDMSVCEMRYRLCGVRQMRFGGCRDTIVMPL